MVELLMGLNRDNRRKALLTRIKAGIDAGHKNMYLLVPEQTTYQFQKELVQRFGPEVALYIEVIDFPTLAERVFEKCGGRTKFADTGAKMMLFSIVADYCRSNKQLKAYKDMATKPEFVSKLVSAADMFTKDDRGPSELRLAAEEKREENPTLANKLDDMAVLIETYMKMAGELGLEPKSIAQILPPLFDLSGFSRGTKWFFDGFMDFDVTQQVLIKTIIEQSDGMTMTLPCAGTSDMRLSSEWAVRTAEIIFTMCDDLGVEPAATRTGDDSSEGPAMAYVQSWLCDSRPATDSGIRDAAKSIRLYADSSIHAECTHIAGSILRAVRRGYRYREMSIVLCDYDRYAPMLESVCARYGIPLYLSSRKEEITKKPIMLAINAALDSATRGMAKEDVLAYLKSGISNLNQEEVATLENYILMWKIHGRAWEPAGGAWTMHPDGFGVTATEASDERLAAINELRERGITPLLHLKAALKEGETLTDHVSALSAFLEEINFQEKLQQFVDELSASGNEQTAQEYAQVFDVLDTAMEQMCDMAGKAKKNAGDFAKLFKMLCGTYKIRTVPPIQDQVCAYSIDDARFFCTKIRFFMGADDQSFPQYKQSEGLFSSGDATALMGSGVDIPGDPGSEMSRMMAEISISVSGAKRMLVMSYCTDGDRGPSPLYRRVQQMFPNLNVETATGEDKIFAADLMHPLRAGELMGRLAPKDKYAEIALTIGLNDIPVVQDAAVRVINQAEWTLRDLSSETVKDLYGNVIPLSATRVDAYSSCRYNFFLRYGLGVKVPNRNKLAGPVVGSFYHDIIEHVCREVESKHGGFASVEDNDVRKITKKHIDKYTAEKMSGMEGQSQRNTYLYKYMCREVARVIRTLAVEFRNSNFHPAFFEFKIGGENADMPAIEIRAGESKGKFTGRVDRIDTYNINDRTIIRINDYKTGSNRTFSLTDILNGQGTQLLVYNRAVTKDGLPGVAQPEAAGILYTPAKHPTVATKSKESEDKIAKERAKMLKREGILINDKDILNAMEHFDADTKLLPIKINSQGEVTGSVCSADQMDALNRFAELALKETLRGIVSGQIAANPISRGPRRNSCLYCPNKGACHKDACQTKYTYIEEKPKDEAMEEIRRRLEEEEKREGK